METKKINTTPDESFIYIPDEGIKQLSDGVSLKKKEKSEYDKGYYKKTKQKRLLSYKANKENISKQRKKYRIENKQSLKEQLKIKYQKNKEEIKRKNKEYYNDNKEIARSRVLKYYHKNKLKLIEKNKQYRIKNREILSKKTNEYSKNRRKKDELFNMKKLLRRRAGGCFKLIGLSKPTNTITLLGADWIIVKMHIERQFKDGMCWRSRGKWHIDHIIPLSSAKTKEDMIKLFHYTNLQPLWANDNIRKATKIPNVQLKLTI